jgi:hypothetical protein
MKKLFNNFTFFHFNTQFKNETEKFITRDINYDINKLYFNSEDAFF